jgi:dihydrofolate reductase
MTRVTTHMSLSLDGAYAGPRFDGEGNWMASAEAAAFFRITRWVVDAAAWRERQGIGGGEANVDSDLVDEQFTAAGAYVMGRRMFDGGDVPWGEEPPFRAPVFVVTNRPRAAAERKGGTTFTFVTDGLASAVAQAKEAAGGKDVALAGGGTLVRGALAAGVVDRLDLHIAPVVVGEGMRLFDSAGLALPARTGIELTPTRVVASPQVTHVRYEVAGPAALGLDDLGRDDTPA